MKKKDLSAAAAEATQRLFSAAGQSEDEGAPIRKPLNETEQKILELYNAGTTVQKDIADAIGKDKGTVSRALKRIREEYPEMLKEREDGQQDEKQVQAVESKGEPEKVKEKPESKPQKQKKQVFSFRADGELIKRWRVYASACPGMKVDDLGTLALQEYIENHKLTGDAKAFFEKSVESKESN